MMSSKHVGSVLLSILSSSLLSACGGGGSSSDGNSSTSAATSLTTQPAITSFPLQAAYKTRVANGATNDFNISGSCLGSAKLSTSSTSGATFKGNTVLGNTATTTMSFTNCSPATIAASSIGFYDTNYNMLGHASAGIEYGEFESVPAALPTSVKVGDTAIYGTESVYTDSTKQTRKGQRTLSYVIEANDATSAVVNLITRDFNTSNQLLFTQQSKYRISGDGTLTPTTIDIQYSTTGTNHFVLTAN